MVAETLWVYRDDTPPSWDQAHYLNLTLTHKEALLSGGLPKFFSSLIGLQRTRAPLLTMLTVPVFVIFGAGPRHGVLVNILLWPVLLVTVFALGRRYFRASVGVLAAFLTATSPILFGLAHEFLVEFLMTVLVALTVLLSVKTDGFTRRWECAVLGVVMGLGLLTKITFPMYIVGPDFVLLVVALVSAMRPVPHERWDVRRAFPIAVNVGMIAALAVAVASFWYWPNLRPSWDFARSTSVGTISLTYGAAKPYTLPVLAEYAINIANTDLTWLYIAVSLIAAVSLWLAQDNRPSLVNWNAATCQSLVLASWIAIPFVAVALSRDRDPRFLAPAMPAFAIVVAALLSRVCQENARRGALVGLVMLAVFQLVSGPFPISFLPGQIETVTPVGHLIYWSQKPHGYNHAPSQSWQVDELLTYLATENRTASGVTALTVCSFEESPAFNSLTWGFYIHMRHLPFSFVRLRSHTVDPTELGQCDYLLSLSNLHTAFKDLLPNNKFNRASVDADADISRLFTPLPMTFPTSDGPVTLLIPNRASLAWVSNISNPASVIFDESVEFLGYDLMPYQDTTEGEIFQITYFWRALKPLSFDATVFARVVDEKGDVLISGNDHKPTIPTSRWMMGQIVRDEQGLFVSRVHAHSMYPVRIGLSAPTTGMLAATNVPADVAMAGIAKGVFVGTLTYT